MAQDTSVIQLLKGEDSMQLQIDEMALSKTIFTILQALLASVVVFLGLFAVLSTYFGDCHHKRWISVIYLVGLVHIFASLSALCQAKISFNLQQPAADSCINYHALNLSTLTIFLSLFLQRALCKHYPLSRQWRLTILAHGCISLVSCVVVLMQGSVAKEPVTLDIRGTYTFYFTVCKEALHNMTLIYAMEYGLIYLPYLVSLGALYIRKRNNGIGNVDNCRKSGGYGGNRCSTNCSVCRRIDVVIFIAVAFTAVVLLFARPVYLAYCIMLPGVVSDVLPCFAIVTISLIFFSCHFYSYFFNVENCLTFTSDSYTL